MSSRKSDSEEERREERGVGEANDLEVERRVEESVRWNIRLEVVKANMTDNR